MHFVYILYSTTYNRYYTGATQNPEKRLIRHNAGHTKSTKPYRPWVIVHQEDFDTKTEALKRENQIKKYKKGRAFMQLIRVGTEAVKRGRL